MTEQKVSKRQAKTKKNDKLDYLKPLLELNVRICERPDKKAEKIRRAFDVVDILKDELKDKDREHFICLHLNAKNVVMAKETISIGSLNASIVHPREAFKAALLNGSAAVIFAHNHPSGDPTPSWEDIDITHRLSNIANLVGIRLLDHIIIADDKMYSFADNNNLTDPTPPRWLRPRGKEERQRRKEIKQNISRIRKKLGLTPRKASNLFFPKGECNFYMLEAGRREPDSVTMKLLTLLDNHPELLCELTDN